MQFVIVAMILSVMSFEYLVFIGWVPQLLAYAPEILAIAASAAVVFAGVRSRFQYVRPIYWLIFGALGLVAICGAVANLLEPGPLFAGIRTYLRALPFFFLPAVLAVKERQLRVQLLVLLALCALQLPLAWYQRITMPPGHLTGDRTFGTLMGSGILSLFLICVACVLTGFYLRRRIPLWLYLTLLIVILLPTALNETKATLVLLPIGLMVTFYAGSARGARLKNMLLSVIVLAGFMAIFIPIFDHFITPRWGYGIVEFFTMEGRVERHFMRGTEMGDRATAGRLDTIMAALSELSKDPSTLFFGFGIGNASDSALGSQFVGAYFEKFSQFPTSTLAGLLLEFGVLGLGLVLLLHLLIFADSLAVARQDHGLPGALAVGWTGTTAVIMLCFPYTELIAMPVTSFLYWYFSGLVVASRMRGVQSAVAPEPVRKLQAAT
ncbi:MAG: hypothetical protein WD647_10615 [Steroidobacteraceae bacterium]